MQANKSADGSPADGRSQRSEVASDLTDNRRIDTQKNPENTLASVDPLMEGAYFGVTPRKKESGNSAPQLGITKTGDTHVRRLLVLCAHHLLARGKDCRLKRWGSALCERGGRNAKKRAIVAVARKLAIHLLAVWRSGETYDMRRGVPSAEQPPPKPAT